jgi:hypothetical protein
MRAEASSWVATRLLWQLAMSAQMGLLSDFAPRSASWIGRQGDRDDDAERIPGRSA